MSLQGVTRTVALALLWMGCSDSLPPQRQLLLYVDTDAPLPPAPGVQLADGEPPPLFDTLLVEVQPTDAAEPCDQCTRTFSLDRDTVARVEASFGVPLPDGETPRIRLRLYDSGSTLTGAVPQPTVQVPTVQSVIDITVDADGMGQDGVIEAHVMLPVEQVGLPVGPEAAALSLGKPNSSQVGTWPYARRVDCAEPANPDEVCIAGGAFWMGNPRERGSGIGDAHNLRRLVVLSPFFIDRTEVTVAQYRAFAGHGTYPAIAWGGVHDGAKWQNFCTYTEQPGAQDDMPVTCLPIAGARAYCESRGGRLPTEAQFEYVAGAFESRLFVWGSDEPSCDDAVLLRWESQAPPGVGPVPQTCPPVFSPGSPDVVGSLVDPPRRDRLDLAGGPIFDLVGNAAEWVSDSWNRQDEPCWSGGGVYRDFECGQPSPADGDARVFRGGSWIIGPRQATAAHRGGPLRDVDITNGQGIDLGFRCVRPATPAAL